MHLQCMFKHLRSFETLLRLLQSNGLKDLSVALGVPATGALWLVWPAFWSLEELPGDREERERERKKVII